MTRCLQKPPLLKLYIHSVGPAVLDLYTLKLSKIKHDTHGNLIFFCLVLTEQLSPKMPAVLKESHESISY